MQNLDNLKIFELLIILIPFTYLEFFDILNGKNLLTRLLDDQVSGGIQFHN